MYMLERRLQYFTFSQFGAQKTVNIVLNEIPNVCLVRPLVSVETWTDCTVGESVREWRKNKNLSYCRDST